MHNQVGCETQIGREATILEQIASSILARAEEIRGETNNLNGAADRMYGACPLGSGPITDTPARDGYIGKLEDAMDSLADAVNSLSNAGSRITERI